MNKSGEKIVLSAGGTTLAAPFDTRFGRAEYFIVYDPGNGEWECHPNTQNLNAAQGAGIQAAQTVHLLGAGVLVTGHVGPKAFKVLQANGTRVYTAGEATVQKALDAFRAGKLTELTSPDVEGHW